MNENQVPKDRLTISSQRNKSGQISVKKNTISFGCVVVATFTGGNQTDPNLVITFNSAATEAAVQAVAQRVSCSTKSKASPQPARQFLLQVVNLGDLFSNAVASQIHVVGKRKA